MHIRIEVHRTPITTSLIEKFRISPTKSKRSQHVRALLLDRFVAKHGVRVIHARILGCNEALLATVQKPASINDYLAVMISDFEKSSA